MVNHFNRFAHRGELSYKWPGAACSMFKNQMDTRTSIANVTFERVLFPFFHSLNSL